MICHPAIPALHLVTRADYSKAYFFVYQWKMVRELSHHSWMQSIATQLNSNLDNLVYSLWFHTCVWSIRETLVLSFQPHKNGPTPTQPTHAPFEQNKHMNPLCPPLFGTSSSLQFFLTILHLNPCSFAGFLSTDLTPEWWEAPARGCHSLVCTQSHQRLHTSPQNRHLTALCSHGFHSTATFQNSFSSYSSCPVYFSRWHSIGVFLNWFILFFFCPRCLRGQCSQHCKYLSVTAFTPDHYTKSSSDQVFFIMI